MDTRFFNRELSWLEFNARVLDEALQEAVPPLERVRFLAIVSSNFDEFFMVRVSTLKRQVAQGRTDRCSAGMTPAEQLDAVHRRVRGIVEEQLRCLRGHVLPALAREGLRFVEPREYTADQLRYIQTYFAREVLPALTPIRVDLDVTFPFVSSLTLNVLFSLGRRSAGMESERAYALVQVPRMMDRFIWIPESEGRGSFTLVEDVIASQAAQLFPGYQPNGHVVFRVTRDADLGVDEERDEDFVAAMEEVVVSRQQSFPVRLQICGSDAELSGLVRRTIGVEEKEVYVSSGPLDVGRFMDIAQLRGYDHLRYPPWPPVVPPAFSKEDDIWDAIRQRDILLHHPYDSFEPVAELVHRAASDPNVLAIKMTLYRTSGESPLVKALAEAAKNGKQVSVLVELKARFDEERNISWALQLERSGVIVLYGIARLKVHAKALLVVRKERDGVRRYVHLGTGNYNDRTARLYVDYGLLTARDELTYETALFFNSVTGYSSVPSLRRLIMAPHTLKPRLLELIEREIDRTRATGSGAITAKLNALADTDIIEALYRASCAGVDVRLNVRGVCLLVPGVPGMSERIEVVSVVDRFLEHSRIVSFSNGGDDEVYLTSADWMPRNLDRRVELLFPIEQRDLRRRLQQDLLMYFRDNQKAHALRQDGSYERRRPEPRERAFRVQQMMYQRARRTVDSASDPRVHDFVVRRRPDDAGT